MFAFEVGLYQSMLNSGDMCLSGKRGYENIGKSQGGKVGSGFWF